MAPRQNPDATLSVAIDADTSRLQEEFDEVAKSGLKLGNTLANAFDGIANKGKSLGDVMRQVGLSISKMALSAAFKPLESALSNGLSSVLSGSALPFARGGALNQGMPIPFASGGVISSPMTFPLSGGRTGLAGEAGPEAIMPLTRGADGRLGVASTGAGGAVHVTFNVTSPDADSFRRSESQLAAMLARTVTHGQRNL